MSEPTEAMIEAGRKAARRAALSAPDLTAIYTAMQAARSPDHEAASALSALQTRVDELRKALFQMRDMLIAVHDGLEDEGDRVYLGSSNHAELIHEAWHFADALKWDEIMETGEAQVRSPTGDA